MPDTMIHKLLEGFEIKDAEKGIVEAIIATLGVVDKDEDVITETAIPSGSKVTMSSYGHEAVYGERPVGKGEIIIREDLAIFRGKMFLTTQGGRDTFEVLKEMGSDQQWSFGFRILGSEVPSDDWKKKGARRMLTKLDAFEVSPVIVGAGIGTRTLGVKAAEEPVVPDPAIKAARLKAEEDAKALADINARADRMFKREVVGIKR